MKCKKCGRDIDTDNRGIKYHESDLMWVEYPDYENSGERIPLAGARPAKDCNLPSLK